VKYFHQKKRFIKSFCHIVSPHSQIKHPKGQIRYFKKEEKIAEYIQRFAWIDFFLPLPLLHAE